MALLDLEKALGATNEEKAGLQESNSKLRVRCHELAEQYEAIKSKDDEHLALIVDLKAELRRLTGDRCVALAWIDIMDHGFIVCIAPRTTCQGGADANAEPRGRSSGGARQDLRSEAGD